MKKSDIISNVKAGFSTLLISDPVIEALFDRSVGFIEDKGGPSATFEVNSSDWVVTPSNMTAIVSVADANATTVDYNYIESESKIMVPSSRWTVWPVTVTYLISLRDIPSDQDLPRSIVSQLERYLAAQVKVMNREREYQATIASGLSTDGMATASELADKVASIEEEIEAGAYLSLMPCLVM